MELTNLQREKVDELTSLYKPSEKTKIDFKAPTGSGKTLMATAFISELISQNPNDQFVFVIATPSSSDLPYSFEQKILQYKQDLPFSDFTVEYIKSPSETNKNDAKIDGTIKIIPEVNKIFIFGKSSFGKDRILTTRHIIDDFVSIINDNAYKLIYIRDEAHIGGNIVKDETFESLMQNNASLIIKMTATPNYKDQTINKVILSEEDLNNPIKNDGRYLLKTTPVMLLNGVMTDEELLDNAIEQFKQRKKEYKELESEDIYIRPALLVQVDNDSKTDSEKSRLFFETLDLIKKKFEANAISYAQYFGNNEKDSNTIHKSNFTLDEISNNDSDFDAVIFKIGPATGWDIPRACMLLQLRNVCSDSLNIQTIGRIKRNCYRNLEKNDITDKYYIYSNAPQDNNITIFEAKVKDKFINEEFMSIEITNVKDCSKKVSEQGLKTDIDNFLSKNKNKIIQYSKELFIADEDGIYYKDIHATTTGGQYISKITNVFQFIKIYNNIKNSNADIFEKCEKIFLAFWKANYNKTCINTFPYTKEIFYITLIQCFKNDIVNLINKNKQYKPQYKVVSSPYDPKCYTEIYSTEVHEVKTKRIHSYLFDTKFGNNEHYQPIGENDKSPEVWVFEKISDLDDDLECIKVWGKNFTTSNVNGAYIDKYNNLKHSYFDFVIKFNNKALLYIEVKGEKDINSEKTEMLKGAYKEYFEKQSKTLFDKPVIISVFKVNTVSGNITHESFYDTDLFAKDLNSLSVDELVKEISSIDVVAIE